MAPSIVWNSLPDSGKKLRVLDPMAGSGTTLVSALAKGHHAIGCDTDPLALLIARAWCSNVDPYGLRYRGELVLERAKKLSASLISKEAYPAQADSETRKFIDFWFDKTNRIQLTALSKCISQIHDATEKTLLWCAFSRLIITKKSGVSLAIDISHSRPHKKYRGAPIHPFDKFLLEVDYIAKKAPFNNHNVSTVILRRGDARSLPVKNNSVDMVITSPPYLNAIDYIRGHKFSLVWMGYSIASLRKVRSGNIGSERSFNLSETKDVLSTLKLMVNVAKLNRRNRDIVLRYVSDMNRVFSEVRRVLKREGLAVFVIGDSTVRGVFIKNSDGLIHLAQRNGLQLISKTTRPIPINRRYLPPPDLIISGSKMQGRMKEEVILKFAAMPEI